MMCSHSYHPEPVYYSQLNSTHEKLTWSWILSWCPAMADTWWGYFCFRSSRKASLLLSAFCICIASVCFRGSVRGDQGFDLSHTSLLLDFLSRLSTSSAEHGLRSLFTGSDEEMEKVRRIDSFVWGFVSKYRIYCRFYYIIFVNNVYGPGNYMTF